MLKRIIAWWYRRRARLPSETYEMFPGIPDVFMWSRGQAVETETGTGYVMTIDYNVGKMTVGVWRQGP